ncbi:lactonase family protein [Flavobacterium pallidum]|uniref:6-phosphogluconolactonase n=1 Tax=Flavobacterium pallidum TaxID=2172098 RepID=A0A2S1SLJ4_9FLAO|nr:lactonase family protein [Flavobacterium pallidum]AWI27273.1 6-phosphogluconolactonase [Flavobacterium pallidum]
MKRTFLYALLMFVSITKAQTVKLIVGTYTNSCDSNGIYVFDFNTNDAQLKLVFKSDATINPSYVALSPDNQFLYSVNENGNESKVSAFYFNKGNGDIDFLGSQDAKGADPCYILNDDKNVIVANYSGGSISVFKKNKFGALNEAKQVIKLEGRGPNTQRQESAHLHMVQFSPDNKYVLANDLGSDKMYVYGYNADSENNVLQLKNTVSIKAGSGPRHLTFSPDGKFVYLLQELDGTLTVYAYADGTLTMMEEKSVVASGFKGKTSAADIHIAPGGKFLYATNRGDANDISVFAIKKDGTLDFVQRLKTMGQGPRNFAIDPTGKYLLVGHQYTNNIVIFDIDKTSGKLTFSGKMIPLCAPVCLLFAGN